jgi:hypothetical protein
VVEERERDNIIAVILSRRHPGGVEDGRRTPCLCRFFPSPHWQRIRGVLRPSFAAEASRVRM